MNGLLGNLAGIVKRGAFGGLLQNDEDLLRQYIPEQFRQNLTPEQIADAAQKARGIASAALFSPGVDANERMQLVQNALLGDIAGRQQAEQKRQMEAMEKARQDYVGKLTAPTVTPSMALEQGNGRIGPTAERAAVIGQANPNRLSEPKANAEALRMIANRLMAVNPAQAEKYLEMAGKLDPQFKTQSVQSLIVGDKTVKFAIGEDGSKIELGVAPEDLMEVNTGGEKLLVSKNTGKEISKFGVTMTPDAKASNAVAWANVNLRKQELEKPQIMDTAEGLISVNPRTLETRPVVGPTGAPIPGKQKDLPEGVMNAQGFADRMQNAESILKTKPAPGTTAILARGVPFAGNVLGNLANSPEQQQYYQAAQDWIRAKLRKESGAAIGVDEMAQEYATYFPQIGDSPDVIKQKELAREQATLGMIRAGGSTYKPNLVSQKEPQKKNEQPKTFDRLPDPAQFNGKVMESDAGIRYRSNGKTWVREMK